MRPFVSALADRLRDWRNRRIADPAFRAWAAAFPPTRPMARREARRLFDLSAGFVYSQVLAACVQCRLFERLADKPLALDAVARAIDLTETGALRLLKAAAALDLVEKRAGERWALGPLGAAMLGNEGAAAMIAHHDMLYADLRDPLAVLRGEGQTALNAFWAYAGNNGKGAGSERQHGPYSALMGASQALVAGEVLGAYPFAKHRLLLDLGGGDASFLRAAAKNAADLRLMLFDLPPVAAIAEARIREAGLANRAKAFGGSFFTDPLPAGADLITLNRILHDHDDEAAAAILRAARGAIAPGGTLLIAEPMAETAGARAMGDAYFGFYLAAMGQGRPRAAGELAAMAKRAGFVRARQVPTRTPLIVSMIAAQAD